MSRRPPSVHHCTSEPYHFFGRGAELALLDGALAGGGSSIVALVGPGGQGKTAILQHWLASLTGVRAPDGVFLWSFYRGKDADVCLRELAAYADRRDTVGDVSASWCVDHILKVLRVERWALLFDGTEVVQHDEGPWFGRFTHPELGRLLEELASERMPGVAVLTSRFPLPDLERRRYTKVVSLSGLDAVSARGLLRSVGAVGTDAELDDASSRCGRHAKAVELLGTYLARFHGGAARRCVELPPPAPAEGASDEEHKVSWVMAAYQSALPVEEQDVLALATAFRDPPAEARLLDYLASKPVRGLLHDHWGRTYTPFADRPAGWLQSTVDGLVRLRLLERVGGGTAAEAAVVVDAHPLVRRSFDHVLGPAGRKANARARAGFLRGRPDRRRAVTLDQAREEVELFHAWCDAGLWDEADSVYVALQNPKHRLLVPALERDLLLRFFPGGDWRKPPSWPGFGRKRSLAICFELLGQFEDALAAYPPADAALRGDALLALGRLKPLLDVPRVQSPWQTLWGAYRAHALILAGDRAAGVALARSLVPVDVYEWVHIFEALLRADDLAALDLRSVLYRPPTAGEHRWGDLARQRMRADFERVTGAAAPAELAGRYRSLVEEYDRAGLPFERTLTRLSLARCLSSFGDSAAIAEGAAAAAQAAQLAGQFGMEFVALDAAALSAGFAAADRRDFLTTFRAGVADSERSSADRRSALGYRAPTRP